MVFPRAKRRVNDVNAGKAPTVNTTDRNTAYLIWGFIMRTLFIRLWSLLGTVTATAVVTVIGPATAIATARLAGNHNEVMASR
jgi:hypothetical protein